MGVPKRVLLVDDDTALRQSLAEQLEIAQEFSTVMADSGAAGFKEAKAERFDLILLDVGLPDLDGREVCRNLRRDGVRTPVIMLTAADGDADTVLGLESGANDYITKPFKLNVLLARMRVQLRQHEQGDDATLSIGPYSFRPGAKLLIDNERRGKKVRLTEKEVSILRYLYRAEGQPVAREVLLTEVWGYNAAVNTHTLETHIYRLRQKIERDPAAAALILTGPGGYRLAS
jgi:DNA-binding response OmpR family regulator